MPALSLRRNFSWNLAGSALYNASQWLLMVLLARLADPRIVGEFALSLGIAAPVFLCLGLNLRIVLATDATRRWPIPMYLRARSLTGVASILVTLVVGFALHLRGLALLSLAVIAVAKSVEALGQTLYGYYQLHGRLDYVAGSMLLRAGLGSALFFTGFLLTHQLVFACCGLLLGWTSAQILWDVPHSRRLMAGDPSARSVQPSVPDSHPMRSLVVKAAPLGVDAGLNSLIINTPRYAIQVLMSTAHLGRFAVLAYLAQVITMITGSLADGVVSQLAHAHAAGRRKYFDRLLVRLCLFSLGISGVIFVVCLFVGAQLVRALLGPQYVDQPLLLLLVLAATISTLQRCVSRGLQASHQFLKIAITDGITLAIVTGSCVLLVPRFGLPGAAAAISVGTLAGTVVATALLRTSLRDFPADARAREQGRIDGDAAPAMEQPPTTSPSSVDGDRHHDGVSTGPGTDQSPGRSVSETDR